MPNRVKQCRRPHTLGITATVLQGPHNAFKNQSEKTVLRSSMVKLLLAIVDLTLLRNATNESVSLIIH